MKLIIKKNIFINALKNVSSVVDENNYNTILSAILVDVKKNKITLTATNGSLSCKEEIDSNFETQEEGIFLIKAKVFYSILSKLDNDDVIVQLVDNNTIQIKNKTYSCNINCLDSFSYPIINFNYEKWSLISFDRNDLNFIVNNISIFCAIDAENKINILSGVNFYCESEKEIEATATNGHRLGFYKFKPINWAPINFTINYQILKILLDISNNKKTNEIKLYFNNNNAIFQMENTQLSFSLFNIQFPNIKNVLFKEQEKYIEIETCKILSALKRGTSFTSQDKKNTVLIRKKEKKVLEIDFSTEELGFSHEEIEIVSDNVDSYSVKLNQNYFIQILSCIKEDKVKMCFNGCNEVIILKTNNQNYLNIILPIKIN